MRSSLFVSAALLLVGATAAAQPAPKFEYGKAEEVKKEVEWKASAQAGLIITTGNSKTTTLSASGMASRRQADNKVLLEAAAAYATSTIIVATDGNGSGTIDAGEITRTEKTTTSSWLIKARYDRFFGERNSLFATARVGADRPAGKQLVAGFQLGYSRLLIKSAMHELAGEAGYDFTYENFVAAGDPISIHSARLFLGYVGKLSEATGVDASTEVLLNLNKEQTPSGEVGSFEDTRFTGKIGLTTTLYTDISLRFGFTALYDQAPAPAPTLGLPYAAGFVPLADKLDTKTEVSLIVNFL